MSRLWKLTAVLAVMILTLLAAVPALATVLPTPAIYLCTVYEEGNLVGAGKTVEAFMGGGSTAVASATTDGAGKALISFSVQDTDLGKELTFKVDGFDADETPDVDISIEGLSVTLDYSPAAAVYYTLTVTPNPAGAGTVAKDPDLAEYLENEVVTLTASPNAGYIFKNWSEDASGTNPTVQVTMDGNKTVTANFEQVFTLDIFVNPSGAGTITVNPTLAEYPEDTVVTLTANPNAGYGFKNWSGDASGSNPTVQITMDADKSVTANFVPVYTLAVTISPSGKGTVAKNPDLAEYLEGTSVTLYATAISGYRFKNWSGDASGTNPTVQVTMNANKSVTANFEPVYTLTITVSPSGKGTVTKNPNLAEYAPGTEVTLTATPTVAGWRFSHWSGAASGTNPTITVTMDANKSVTAYFEQTFAAWLYDKFVKCL